MKSIQTVLITTVSWALIPLATASAQQVVPSALTQTRTRAIAASFNKSKHVVKEKRGVHVEKYKEVRSEPLVKANPQDYSGTYEVPEMGFALQLQVDKSGSVTGTGYEPAGPGSIRAPEIHAHEREDRGSASHGDRGVRQRKPGSLGGRVHEPDRV